jgi:hypothetical protein
VAAIASGRRAWLLHFRDAIGQHAHLWETDEAWVLSSYDATRARAAARFVATTRRRITQLLDGLARFPSGTRSTLVVLDDLEQYYRYITNYYPDEGEFALSSGVFIKTGCPHFVTVADDLSTIEPVIAHEMTHASLAYLRLPRWLDEGIAVTTEHHVTPRYRRADHELELMAAHLEFWDAARMQEFWSGKCFRRTDDGNRLSYDLARKIVGLVGREWSSFTKFVRGVKRADAGAAAAISELKFDLGQLAAAAIRIPVQPGFTPDPQAWKSGDA